MFDKLLAIACITLLCKCAPWNGYVSRELYREPGRQNEQGVIVVDLMSDEGFWFANFTVGTSKDLSLLVDTGSADVGLNTGNYKPSSHSINLNMIGQESYGTTQSNGCGSGFFQENLYLDEVALGCIAVENQTIGSVFASNPAGSDIPHDGIIGFAGQIVSGFNATPFFHTLCNEGHVKECRFGLAFGTNLKGKMVLGEADSGLYKGELSVAPIIEEWFLNGDVTVNGEVIAQEQLIELDSGTANIIGPIDIVQKIFDATGVMGIMTNESGCASTLVGVYPCSQPPTLGFGFPSMEDATVAGGNSGVSRKSTIFDVPASAFPLANDRNGTCTSTLIGVNISLPQSPNRNLWVVGQPFFQTHYLDFNVAEGTVGFADQK